MLQSKVRGTELVRWKRVEILQGHDFKSLSPESMQKLKTSLVKNQFLMPFFVWEDKGQLYLLDGKHRLDVLYELESEGYEVPEELPATFIQCESRKQAAEFILIYSSSYAQITQDGLSAFMEREGLSFSEVMPMIDIPYLDMNINVLDAIDETEKARLEEQKDKVPEAGKDIIVKEGDTFLLNGKHRLLCTDSEKLDEKKFLIGRVDMVFTDPPYQGELGGKPFKNDKALKKCAEDLVKHIGGLYNFDPKPFLDRVMEFVNDKASIFIFCNKKLIPTYINFALEKNKVFDILSWHKPNFIPMNNGKYFPDTEYLIKIKQRGGVFNTGLPKDKVSYGTYWLMDSATSIEHPTVKPVKIITDCIYICTKEDATVLDLYTGSGSTLIACEMTGRKFLGCEISPKYVQVALKRYMEMYPDHKVECLNREVDLSSLRVNNG